MVLVALGLRLQGARSGDMMFDESTHLAAAQTIDFRPDRFHVIPHSVDHPPLSVHVVRASTYLFGDGLFGMRALHALAGGLTVLVIYSLARRAMGTGAALAAAAFLVIDQFHVTWSYFAVPEVLLLLFAALTLHEYVRVLGGGGSGSFIRFGVFLGLTYLAKETAVFLIPALWLGAASEAGFRRVLRDRRWYLAHVIALAVVVPEVVWNLTHYYEGYYHRDASMLGTAVSISPRAFLLYIGELAPLIGGPFAGFEDNFTTQLPAPVHWPAGLFYLAAAGLALFRIRDAHVRLFVVLFAVVFAEFTLLPGEGQQNYWWPSLTLLPAVLLAGSLVQDALRVKWVVARRAATVLVAFFLVFLLGRSVVAVNRQGLGVEFVSAEERVRVALERAEKARTRVDLARADIHLYYAVLVAGGSPSLYAQLARSSCVRSRFDRARYFAARTLDLDPDNAIARGISEELASTADPTCGMDAAEGNAGPGGR